MRFNQHSLLAGRHAFLSPSKSSWVNYDDDKMNRAYYRYRAAQRGTELHALAHDLIRLGVKLPATEQTLNLYVNDAIGYKMRSEQTLYYSDHAFGQPDTICFRDNILRIHDLKTGAVEAIFRQLEVYGALFCLEYKVDPREIETELRVYQNDTVKIYIPEAADLLVIMEKIVYFSKYLDMLRREDA